jgi:hypothetical protein
MLSAIFQRDISMRRGVAHRGHVESEARAGNLASRLRGAQVMCASGKIENKFRAA